MISPIAEIKILNPVLKAYGLGYLASTSPRLISWIKLVKRTDVAIEEKLLTLATILKTSTQPHRFPTAAALIVAGSTSVPRLVILLLQWLRTSAGARTVSSRAANRIRCATTFLAAWLAFDLLNRDQGWVRKRAMSRSVAATSALKFNMSEPRPSPLPFPPSKYAGKTIDFTLFALLRAVDILVISSWQRTTSRPWHPEHRIPRLASLMKKMTDPAIFASATCIIMWAWFYSPERLPKGYNTWISSAADIDPRIIRALRLCRQGVLVYGQDTGCAPLLQSLCDELGLPQEIGDPAKVIPIPCELYHCGAGKSCEVHAVSRFSRSFLFALRLYLPLQLLSKIRSPSKNGLFQATKSAARSSSFLATFVALFYYSVCLARTRFGPKVFSRQTVTPQMWDAGLCISAGCLTCGWSIMIENAHQRQELASFVAPRALATTLPRVYDKAFRRREQVVFATSVAIVLQAVQTGSPGIVRGVLGRVLKSVLRE